MSKYAPNGYTESVANSAKQQEQDRIIKLLEDHAIEVDEGGGCACKNRCSNIRNDFDYQDHLIALIKGENK